MNSTRLLASASLALCVLLPAPARARVQTSPADKQHPATRRKYANPLNALLEEAQAAIERQDFPSALAPLQKLTAEQPDFAYGFFELGYVYIALERWDEARAALLRAIALDPKLSEAHLNLGTLLLDRDPPAAVAPLRKAVELLPAQSRPRYLLGLALERTDDFPGAIESLQSAARLDPGDLETRLALARVLLRAEKFSAAESAARTALSLAPDSAPAQLAFAHALDAQQKPDAAAAYRRYLELQPAGRDALFRLATLLFEQKQYDDSLAALDRLDDGKPPSTDSLLLRADIQVAQSRWDAAILTLQQALQQDPSRHALRAGLGRLFLQKRDFPSAERELLLVVRADAKNLAAWKDLSTTYYLQKNCPAALAALEQVARQEPLVPGAWFVRATCYDRLEQAAAAIEAYQKFIDVDKGQDANQIWQSQQRLIVLRKRLAGKR
jgi:tetratricopeptide (TPR) repeat protein